MRAAGQKMAITTLTLQCAVTAEHSCQHGYDPCLQLPSSNAYLPALPFHAACLVVKHLRGDGWRQQCGEPVPALKPLINARKQLHNS